MKTEQHMKKLGIELSPPTSPMANYVNAVRTGDLLFLAGKGPGLPGKPLPVGKVGRDLTVEQGAKGGRICAINILANINGALGGFDKVVRIVKLTGFVNCMPDFNDPHLVINGCSDLLTQVLGERGKHARSAIGMASLPRNAAVEVEAIVEVK